MSYSSPTPYIQVFGSVPRYYDPSSDPRWSLRSALHPPTAPLPMAIPSTREAAPPPLPPPRHIPELNDGHDSGWQWANGRSDSDGPPHCQSVKPGSSLLGGSPQRPELSRAYSEQFNTNAPREATVMSMPTRLDTDMREYGDEDRQNRPSLARLQSETQLGQREVHNSAQAYDKQLLSRIGGPNANRATVPNLLSSPTHDGPFPLRKAPNKFARQLKPLAVPERRVPNFDGSTTRWPRTPQSALSPASIRSPLFDSHAIDSAFSPRNRNSMRFDYNEETGPASRSHRNSEDQGVFSEPEFAMEESGMRELNLSDESPLANDELQYGQGSLKRRASSPPPDGARDGRASGNSYDLYHRRSTQMLTVQNPPSTVPNAIQGSLVSMASLPPSYGSGWNMSLGSSFTSFNTDRLSPNAISPSYDTEFAHMSPYGINGVLNHAPQAAFTAGHLRTNSDQEHYRNEGSPIEIAPDGFQSFGSNPLGAHACECCLKKPKRFSTLLELQAHEQEKQYRCQYCPNRFKNKNEMERHKNSLHLRQHSWSCATLSDGQYAFHASTQHSSTRDVCGYCGREFTNPPDYETRNDHLANAHKFGECNQQKRFFRADHFRQHLKHSHGGVSGKWTNVLENTCMKDEPAGVTCSKAPAARKGETRLPTLAPAPPSPSTPIGPISSIINQDHAGPLGV